MTALVFKTGEASKQALGGFDSHPLPLYIVSAAAGADIAVGDDWQPWDERKLFTGLFSHLDCASERQSPCRPWQWFYLQAGEYGCHVVGQHMCPEPNRSGHWCVIRNDRQLGLCRIK